MNHAKTRVLNTTHGTSEGGKSAWRSCLRWMVPFAVGLLFATVLWFWLSAGSIHLASKGRNRESSIGSQPVGVRSLPELLALPSDQIASIDIAHMNLICAEGLPGSDKLDIRECLSVLDKWADQIRKDTVSRINLYYSNPARYDNSVAKFKVVHMILTLKNTIGVDYNQEIMERRTFPDSRDVFIHGCISGKKQGGCISIPTLCVAVGRRLGYPLKLVLTKEHVFFRWDDGKEVFNMEACCPGCDSKPDEYYMTWPHAISESDVKANGYLKSLTSSEELALFLDTRGECLYDANRVEEALVCYSQAYQLMPRSMDVLAHVHMAMNNRLSQFRKMNDTLGAEQPRRRQE